MARKTKKGKVISAGKMDKTIIVEEERLVSHPLYQKRYRKKKKYMVHDPENKCREGDFVLIEECRPLSALKRWRLVKILEREEEK